MTWVYRERQGMVWVEDPYGLIAAQNMSADPQQPNSVAMKTAAVDSANASWLAARPKLSGSTYDLDQVLASKNGSDGGQLFQKFYNDSYGFLTQYPTVDMSNRQEHGGYQDLSHLYTKSQMDEIGVARNLTAAGYAKGIYTTTGHGIMDTLSNVVDFAVEGLVAAGLVYAGVAVAGGGAAGAAGGAAGAGEGAAGASAGIGAGTAAGNAAAASGGGAAAGGSAAGGSGLLSTLGTVAKGAGLAVGVAGLVQSEKARRDAKDNVDTQNEILRDLTNSPVPQMPSSDIRSQVSRQSARLQQRRRGRLSTILTDGDMNADLLGG